MPRSRDRAYRLRRWILIGAILCFLAGVWALFGCPPFELGSLSAGVVGTPAMAPVSNGEATKAPGFYIDGALALCVFLAMQWLFLLPKQRWLTRSAAVGRPLRASVIAAAFMAMLLSTAFVASLLELGNWWAPIFEHKEHGLQAVWAAMAVVWIAWTIIFFVYWRQGDRYTQLGRMVRGLIAGSVLEIIVATPIHVWAVRQRECYCTRGSYTGLVFGGAVLIWAFGPGVALLFMRERYRREKLLRGESHECPHCGYDLRGALAAGRTECPECGEKLPQ